ncbi:MAG TPA: leucyl/phenylalanyl-tRNA--protein transferase, partial [Methylophilaceae bacterium]|nr:leucyl/phenylalanyl-tRNA--protein transferase [Methylophilaceae bacterium]
DLKISSSLFKKVKKNNYQFEIDKDFSSVIKHCSEVKRKDQDGTWIDQRIINAYSKLHQMKIAHSFEIYINEKLVGGLYGIILDGVFFGESMFHYETDASKIAFVCTVRYLKNMGVKMIDCQMKTDHLLSFGAKEIVRNQFIQLLNTYIKT